MDKIIVKKEKRLCTCCMEEHEVLTVRLEETLTFKNTPVRHEAEYEYCERADEYYATEKQLSANDLSLKDSYRHLTGLLSSDEICQVRAKYDISQTDLCTLLGWGGKTIARYENHQVQDRAHDTILRKLGSDPEWFLELLGKSLNTFPEAAFRKYYQAAKNLYEKEQDTYLRKAIEGVYIDLSDNPDYTGNAKLSLDKTVDAVSFFSSHDHVVSLYKYKLMKLLWYADALSFKRSGHAITGLIYTKERSGAVPLAHDLIIDLKGISRKEVDLGEGSGYLFTKSSISDTPHLSSSDEVILEVVAKKFGAMPNERFLAYILQEQALNATAESAIIPFSHAQELSIK